MRFPFSVVLVVCSDCAAPPPPLGDPTSSGSTTEPMGSDESSGPMGSSSGEATTDAGGDTTTGVGATGDSGESSGTGGESPHAHLTEDLCGAQVAHPPQTTVFVASAGASGRTASTTDGETWTDVVSEPGGASEDGLDRNYLRAVAYGDGVFIAVGGGDNGYIQRSCDGVHWQTDLLETNLPDPPEAGADVVLNDIAFRNGVFVAVGNIGLRLVSTDYGTTWEPAGEGYEVHLYRIDANAERFVATGHPWDSENEAAHFTSEDGSNWSPLESSTPHLDNDLAQGNGSFIGLGPGRCARTSDGRIWEDCGIALEDGWVFDVVVQVADRFYVSYLDPSLTQDARYRSSEDGSSWTPPVVDNLPQVIGFDGERYVMGTWGQRGWADEFGNWTTSPIEAEAQLTDIVVGEVLYEPPS